MKKILLSLILILSATAVFAQPRGHMHGGPDGQRLSKDERFQQMQSAKIAHFTAELDLSPEEAQVFWPVYNQYSEDLMNSRKENRDAFENICMLMESGQYTEDQLKEALETYTESFNCKDDIHQEYLDKFLEILPAEKVARLYIAEESFRHRMIDNFRGNDDRPDRPKDRPGR